MAEEETKTGEEAQQGNRGDGSSVRQLEALLTQLSEMVSRVETSTLDESERKNLEITRNLSEITRERDRLRSETREWERRYKDSLTRQLLTEAAVSAGAYRADQVVALLSGSIAWSEDGREPSLALASKDGQARVYDRSKLIEGVKAFLSDNPNLASSSASGGAGSRSSTYGGGAKSAMSLAELKRMRPQLEEMARRGGGGR